MSSTTRKKTFTAIGWIAALAVVVAIFVFADRARNNETAPPNIADVQERDGMPVDYVAVRAGAIEDWRRFTGVAEGEEQVDLVAGLRSRVLAVNAELGETVRKNEILVSLDRFEPASAQLNLASLEAAYTTARTDSLRLERLFARGAVSAQEVDHVRASCVQAASLLRSARRMVEIDTPISGLLTALHVEVGDFSTPGDPVATVACFDRIRVPLALSQEERDGIETGQPARLRLPGGGVLTGEVVKAALSAHPETRLYAVELLIDNPRHAVRPGSLVNPEILIDRADSLPLVPRVAVTDAGGVYVIEGAAGDARAAFRPISSEIDDGDFVAVTEGVAAGERVVVWGQNRLSDGLRVKPVSDLGADYYANTFDGR